MAGQDPADLTGQGTGHGQVTLPGTEMDLNCFEAALSLCLGCLGMPWEALGSRVLCGKVEIKKSFLLQGCSLTVQLPQPSSAKVDPEKR